MAKSNHNVVALNAATYDRIATSYRDVTRVHAPQEEKRIEEGIALLHGQVGLVIDLGCGVGRDVNYWLKKNFHYLGVDTSMGMLALARKESKNAWFVVGDMAEVEFKRDSCLIVWASSSLQHIPSSSIGLVMKKAFNWLQVGGIFYANYRPPKPGVPKEGLVSSTEYREDNKPTTIERFVAHYSEEEMVGYAKAAGFEGVHSEEYSELYGEYNAEKAKYLPTKNILFVRKRL